ncbi:hypothetical protein DL89DRAFT_264362 [Linderina pennispora]|uniref:Uncharacterized protein n=1 Tax=Linderina pennispora TaxID=61395 RepID=A0A1Y1VU26_9FUNG|nr:uncharacterized protein DL89DRAFT_271868 [Linderina pennispora]XP_040747714.1 uncharacterized protein DL89DRAFT_264362 [Linderina pennispora]ORX64799.1 hypothetical protein DL89DRAFT_271868 [Linderina pennispora]ORX74503.1 hypothetical protein DL89DRAFT_264362 [Linderina pennispora]
MNLLTLAHYTLFSIATAAPVIERPGYRMHLPATVPVTLEAVPKTASEWHVDAIEMLIPHEWLL